MQEHVQTKANAKSTEATNAEFSRVWSQAGLDSIVASVVRPTLDAGLEFFQEWQNFIKAGADVVESNIRVAAKGLEEVARCKTANELREASASLTSSITVSIAESTRKLATTSADYTNRLLQSNARWASQLLVSK